MESPPCCARAKIIRVEENLYSGSKRHWKYIVIY
jgi:hypothetical protein